MAESPMAATVGAAAEAMVELRFQAVVDLSR